MKILDGRELAGFVKERQAQVVRGLKGEHARNGERDWAPKLLIIRDSDDPVISKYVELKKRYGEDIGVMVVDVLAQDKAGIIEAIKAGNTDKSVAGMIVQLPLKSVPREELDAVLSEILPSKDVDGLRPVDEKPRVFESATATAIMWLLSGYNVELNGKKLASVGRGKLVGAPLIRMWKAAGLDVSVFGHDADLSRLVEFDVIVTATGVPGLIKPEMVKAGAVVVDAGTASENGVLVGDVNDELRAREDLLAITPRIGGVGPLTVSVLFENVINA